jgi:hypothetical protein
MIPRSMQEWKCRRPVAVASAFRETLRLAPDFPEAHEQLAGLLALEPPPAAGL